MTPRERYRDEHPRRRVGVSTATTRQRRTALVTVRATEAAMTRWRGAAERAGLGLSEVVRGLLDRWAAREETLPEGSADETTLPIRVTERDRELLRRAARADGTTISAIVRYAAVVEACTLLGLSADEYLYPGAQPGGPTAE